jgi:hypothetical protein
LKKLIVRAGVKPLLKLWQDLRASGATHFARSLPSHVAAEICGHTEQIAKEHYWTVSDSDLDLDLAMTTLSPGISEKLATKLATKPVSEGLKDSLNVSTATDEETKKPLVSQGFDDICRLMTAFGISLEVGEEGLEPPTSTV